MFGPWGKSVDIFPYNLISEVLQTTFHKDFPLYSQLDIHLHFSEPKLSSPVLGTLVTFTPCAFWPYDDTKVAVMFIVIYRRADSPEGRNPPLACCFGLSQNPEARANFVNTRWALPGQWFRTLPRMSTLHLLGDSHSTNLSLYLKPTTKTRFSNVVDFLHLRAAYSFVNIFLIYFMY